jgi:hypothetical protein
MLSAKKSAKELECVKHLLPVRGSLTLYNSLIAAERSEAAHYS